MAYLDVTVPLRWADLDGYRHVNNTAFLRLLEEARIQAFWRPSDHEVHLGAHTQPTALSEYSPGGAYQTFVVSHHIEYLRQLPYRREGVLVRMWASKLGSASLDVDYEVLAKDDEGSPYAKARTVIVMIDSQTGRPTRISCEVRDALTSYTGDPISFRH